MSTRTHSRSYRISNTLSVLIPPQKTQNLYHPIGLFPERYQHFKQNCSRVSACFEWGCIFANPTNCRTICERCYIEAEPVAGSTRSADRKQTLCRGLIPPHTSSGVNRSHSANKKIPLFLDTERLESCKAINREISPLSPTIPNPQHRLISYSLCIKTTTVHSMRCGAISARTP